MHDPVQGSLLAQLLDCVPFRIYLSIFNPVVLFLSLLEFINVVVLGKKTAGKLWKKLCVCVRVSA